MAKYYCIVQYYQPDLVGTVGVNYLGLILQLNHIEGGTSEVMVSVNIWSNQAFGVLETVIHYLPE